MVDGCERVEMIKPKKKKDVEKKDVDRLQGDCRTTVCG
jgi:hypothetical protein